jgi:RNA polymerase sigma factor (sigma-70 family)
MRFKRRAGANYPYHDRKRLLALRDRSVQHKERCLELLGSVRERRKGASGEAWDGPIREALADEFRPNRAEALREWEAAQALWWEMALTAEVIAKAQAKKMKWVVDTIDGLTIEDLEVAGLAHCYRAAQTWDPQYGASWPTYASRAVSTGIHLEAREMRMSSGSQEHTVLMIINGMTKMRRETGQAYLPAVLEWLGIERKTGERLYQIAQPLIRLDQRIGPDQDDALIGDRLADDPVDVARAMDQKRVAQLVHDAIDQLPRNAQRVIRGRMSGLTLAQVGDSMGLSRERIRQIELDGRERLKIILSSRFDSETELECMREW